MRKTYLSIRSLLSAGVLTGLSWLGMSGCDRSGCDRPGISRGEMMYGTPTVSYQFKVKVSDQVGKPVEGLKVGLEEDNESQLTNGEGVATIAGSYTGFYEDHEVTFKVNDIDGEKNGMVTNINVTKKVTKSDFTDKGDGGWNNGTVKKDINLKVERK